jgi:NADH-quinone oxidoreductase subunit N
MLGKGTDEPVLISDLAGVGFKRPLAGLALTLFMISLGGIPPTAGFMGKILVFNAAVKAGLIWPLVIVGVLNSVISVFYYLRVTVAMYMREPEGEPVAWSWNVPGVVAVLITAGLTIYFGLQSQGLWIEAQRSVLGLL